jgi:(2Fe-2S) ferredoxin
VSRTGRTRALGYNFRKALPQGSGDNRVMSYYRRHVFFCCNKRDPGEKCCADLGAFEMQKYAKGRIKALGMSGKDNVRINKSGCLDRCEEGPIIVVYPEAVWYTYVDREDIDEIIDKHVVGGEIVERLRI